MTPHHVSRPPLLCFNLFRLFAYTSPKRLPPMITPAGATLLAPLISVCFMDCIPHPCSRGKARGRLEPAAPQESKAPAQRHAFKGDGEGP